MHSIWKGSISFGLVNIPIHLYMASKPSEYADTYAEEIKKIIRQKAKGKTTRLKKEKAQKSPKIHDMMSLLKQSLESSSKKRRSA